VPPSRDEVARLGNTLNEMLERLSKAFMRERVFVADASHQLRTPLAILRAEIELALKQGRSTQELREALASAAEETDRLAALANDLLELAQLDGGALSDVEAVSVRELVDGVLAREDARARAASIVLRASAAGTATVHGDAPRLEQALCNVVENALRFAHSEVVLSTRLHAAAVELHVTDDGPGFEPQLLHRAFERFARGTRRREDGGVGLGLAIVAAVVHAHGGEVHAANRVEGGAEVSIILPLTQAETRAPREPARA
jgi:signal transduction histidine kinase